MVLDSVTKAGKVGLLLYLAALLFFLIGFSVPYWFVAYTTSETHRCGLWECCLHKDGNYHCVSIVTNSNSLPEDSILTIAWFRGTQALACLALITIIVNIVVRVLSIYGKSQRLYLISVVLDSVAVALIFLAATVFGNSTANLNVRFDSKVVPVSRHFGFAFHVLGGIFFTGTAICFLIEFLRKR